MAISPRRSAQCADRCRIAAAGDARARWHAGRPGAARSGTRGGREPDRDLSPPPDKQASKSALADAGLARLAQRQQRASARAGGGAAGFLASGLSYAHSADEHPVLFRLMLTHESLTPAGCFTRRRVAGSARARLHRPSDAAGWTATQRKATAPHAAAS